MSYIFIFSSFFPFFFLLGLGFIRGAREPSSGTVEKLHMFLVQIIFWIKPQKHLK